MNFDNSIFIESIIGWKNPKGIINGGSDNPSRAESYGIMHSFYLELRKCIAITLSGLLPAEGSSAIAREHTSTYVFTFFRQKWKVIEFKVCHESVTFDFFKSTNTGNIACGFVIADSYSIADR